MEREWQNRTDQNTIRWDPRKHKVPEWAPFASDVPNIPRGLRKLLHLMTRGYEWFSKGGISFHQLEWDLEKWIWSQQLIERRWKNKKDLVNRNYFFEKTSKVFLKVRGKNGRKEDISEEFTTWNRKSTSYMLLTERGNEKSSLLQNGNNSLFTGENTKEGKNQDVIN